MSDTVTLSRELAERIRRMCVPIKAEVATYNEFEAALAAPQPEPQPVKQSLITAAPALYEALKAVLAVANVRIDDARIGVFDAARAALALVGEQT